MFVNSKNNTFFVQSNNGRLCPLSSCTQLCPTTLASAYLPSASVNQGVTISTNELSVLALSVALRPRSPRPRPRGPSGSMGDPSLVGSQMHMHEHWRESVGNRHTRHASARPCLMGDPSQDAAQAAFQLGAAIKTSYLQVFKANATLALHPCQTAASHLPCTRPPDSWGLFFFRLNPPALASWTDLAGHRAATPGLPGLLPRKGSTTLVFA